MYDNDTLLDIIITTINIIPLYKTHSHLNFKMKLI